MLTTTFQEWLQEFDYQVGIKHNKQRVLLLLDNCKSHKLNNLILENVEVYFLPPQWILASLCLLKNIIGIITSSKWILEQVKAGQFIQDLKMNVLQAIQYIIQGYQSSSFTKYDAGQVKEFLIISEENIVYEIPDDISEFANMFKNGFTNHIDKIDDSTEIEIIGINKALEGLKTVNLFLFQQENANEQINLTTN
ncbi:tigger transposable element-derived protein 4-like [Rhizophagus clarus]|uniref:Tigger transposable element-derived protein 4-like n=1 Tax=Rhizophagus clarus TaxID=94130 RepID=A0A8H3LD87_9GLOM|nr:tigger transposable element-derived protein 4-like [Rhizophagus clarus]